MINVKSTTGASHHSSRIRNKFDSRVGVVDQGQSTASALERVACQRAFSWIYMPIFSLIQDYYVFMCIVPSTYNNCSFFSFSVFFSFLPRLIFIIVLESDLFIPSGIGSPYVASFHSNWRAPMLPLFIPTGIESL